MMHSSMIQIARAVFILIIGMLSLPVALADEQTQQRIQHVKDMIAAKQLEGQPDNIVKDEYGLPVDNKLYKRKFGPQSDIGKKLGDPFVDPKDFLDASTADVKNRLRKSEIELELNKKNILGKVKAHNEALDREAAPFEAEMASLENEIKVREVKKIDAHKKKKNRLEKQIKKIQNNMHGVHQKLDDIRTRRKKLDLSADLTAKAKIYDDIDAAKKRIQSLETSKKSLKFVQHAGVWLQAWSADAEENAAAEREGRPPLAINKIGNFVKNISGYTDIANLVQDVELAKLQSVVDSAEFYERHGIDMASPEIMEHVQASARRAAIRAGLYSGSKMAPVVGDILDMKEAVDSAFALYAAIEESDWIVANNADAQFQNSLRMAMRIESSVGIMESNAKQAKLLTQSITDLSRELSSIQKDIEYLDEQASAALQVVVGYQEFTQAIGDSATPGDKGKLAELENAYLRMKESVDRQSSAISKLKLQLGSSDTNPNQFCADLRLTSSMLDQIGSDFAKLRRSSSAIRMLSEGRGDDAAKALALAYKIRPVLKQQVDNYEHLLGIIRDQGPVLDEIVFKFKGMRNDMQKYRVHINASKSFDDTHRVRVWNALDKANKIDIDQTAIRKSLDAIRNAPTKNELVRSFPSLDRLPSEDAFKNYATTMERAKEAWSKIGPLDEAIAASFAKTIQDLAELKSAATICRKAEGAENTKTADSKPTKPLAKKETKPAVSKKSAPQVVTTERKQNILDELLKDAKKDSGNQASTSSSSPIKSTPVVPVAKAGDKVPTCKACHDSGLACVCGNDTCCCSAPDGWCDPY